MSGVYPSSSNPGSYSQHHIPHEDSWSDHHNHHNQHQQQQSNNNSTNHNQHNNQNSFRVPERQQINNNPILDSFVNDASGFQDPSAALAAAESRCVGLVASAESFAQQRHSKLQHLFKKIQSANTDEVNDLAGRVSICESALQELSGLLEQVQLHIGSASSSTQDFIRNCTVERSRSEGRLLSSMASMLMQYEQQRRSWRKAAAQHLIRQDFQAIRQEGGDLDCLVDQVLVDDTDHDQEEETETDENGKSRVVFVGDDSKEPQMGFLSLEQGASNNNNNSNSNNDDDANNSTTKNQASRGSEQNKENSPTTSTKTKSNSKPKQLMTTMAKGQKNKVLFQYMPESIKHKRKTILQRFSNLLGQMLVDGESVDRPFLLDAAYARIIRYADVLVLHGEQICRHIAEMFHTENGKRQHFLLDGERKIFHQQAEALCPPNLVEINEEPIYTTFVHQLVQSRLEREVSILQMMDQGLEFQKEHIQKVLAQSTQKFNDGIAAVLVTLTKHGVKGGSVMNPNSDGTGNNINSISDPNSPSSNPNSPTTSSSSAAAANSRYYRQRKRGVSLFGGAGGSTGSGGAGGGSIILGGGAGGSSTAGGAYSAVNDANVSAIVSKLLSSSFGELAEPDSTDEKIRQKETEGMQRVIFRLLQEVAFTLEDTHSKLNSTFEETIAAVQPSPINLINNETVFSLDSLNAELSHQALLLKVASTNEGSERNRLTELLKQEKQRSNTLQHDLDERTRQVIILEAALQTKEAEVQELDAAFKVKEKSKINMRNELRQINYEITSDAFGNGWQESILLLREAMLRQMSTEQVRLLSRVKSYQKRKFDDQTRIVDLLEKGFLATQEEVDADHDQKVKEMEIRQQTEIQKIRDSCELRVKNAHLDAESEIKKSREMFEKMYFSRVNELNDSYDDKVRQIEQRQKDWEDRLWSKMKQIRQDFREKEVATERSYAEKHEAVLKIYEEESNTLKKNIAEKEAVLESERLSVHLETERKITEGINKVKSNYETVRSRLQNTMLKNLEEQRFLFEEQRQAELQLFSEFAFGGMQHAKDKAFGIVESNRTNFQKQVEDSQKAVQDATINANEVGTRLLKHRDDLHDKRFVNFRANNEQILRKTQLVRIEQDEKTWNNINKEIVKKGHELDRKQADVESLMAQRYIDIVKTLHSYIAGDVAAAHQTFERECMFRQEQLRKYLNHFHLISLKIESELWRETSGRNDIEREALSTINLLKSRSRAEAEYVMRNAVIQNHVSTLNENADETTFTTVEALRGRYEGLLRRQHQLMGAMSHDYVSSLQHYVAQQNTASEALSQVFSARMDELHVAMRNRWELHWASRDMIVERTLEDIVQVAAESCPEVLGGLLPGGRAGSRKRVRRLREKKKDNSNNNNNTENGTSNNATSDYDYESDDNNTTANNNGVITSSTNNNIDDNNNSSGSAPPPLFYAQDVRIVEYFSKMRQLLSKAFDDLDAKITAGLEERELKQRQHSIDMRAKFLDAAAALTRRAEQLEDKVLDVKMENNSLQAQLQLKSEAEIRAAILADDLKAHVAHYRMLTQNSMIHGSFTNEQNFRENIAAGGHVTSPLTTTGAFKRQQLLQGRNPNLANNHNTTTSSPNNNNNLSASSAAKKNSSNSNNDQQHQQKTFQATFLLDVGGKRATRDVVSENALLRERLMANEWKNDKFLRDALMSAHETREGASHK